METLRPALSCIQGPVDTHSHVPQQRSPYWARTSRRQGFRWQALIWRQGKSWGNISFAAGWRPTPPVLETWPWLLNGASVCCHRPADQGVGTGVGGGGQPHHVPGQASGATQPPSPWATPGPRLESFRLEKPTSPSSPPHLEATSQIQPAEGSQRNQAGPQLALDLQVSPVSGPHMSPGQAAASPTPQGHSLRHQGRHRRMCPYLSVCGSVAGPPVLPRGGGGPP